MEWVESIRRQMREQGILRTLFNPDLIAMIIGAIVWGLLFVCAALFVIVGICVGLIGGIIVTFVVGVQEAVLRLQDFRRRRCRQKATQKTTRH